MHKCTYCPSIEVVHRHASVGTSIQKKKLFCHLGPVKVHIVGRKKSKQYRNWHTLSIF